MVFGPVCVDPGKKLKMVFCLGRLARTLRGTLSQLQEKCQQYNRLAQDLQITSDEALDFEFKLREREAYLESEIQAHARPVMTRFKFCSRLCCGAEHFVRLLL
jgi:hypothetical protein